MSGRDPAVRVLLVEDNETIRDAFGILLRESGYDVLEAATGAAALEVTRAHRPDLILMDLGLPDTNGLDVTRTLKLDAGTADIPIVALTGRALETDEQACREAGCVGYLAKPIDTRQLLRRIPEYLQGTDGA